MTKTNDLATLLQSKLTNKPLLIETAFGEVTVQCSADNLITTVNELKKNKSFAFDQLIDICAVDYLLYGRYDWETEAATEFGFSRAVEFDESRAFTCDTPRFAVVYHLLSTTKNHRLRLKVYLHEDNMVVPSVNDIWKSANWFEREAYDLYGVLFEGHPDLRRILTDYGFIGHPFRKDFPVSGHVEMRYDAQLKKVIYEPVDIEPRLLGPKIIRNSNRHIDHEESAT